MHLKVALYFLVAVVAGTKASAQQVEVVLTSIQKFPGQVDSNSPAHWQNGEFHIFNSIGSPKLASGENQSSLGGPVDVKVENSTHFPMWIEATWIDNDGTLYAWYHHEPQGLCGPDSSLTAPQIGALISYDGGATFRDLGIILNSGDPLDCNAQNGYFAGGTGDFSVILDHERQYFYFIFSNYGGPVENQGVAMARLPFFSRRYPVGAVRKYFDGGWQEPGLGGKATAILPANTGWSDAAADAYWGPSIHWNTYLASYVILLNHACCSPGWPQEGIYIAFNPDLSHPLGWSGPQKILDGVSWYPQVIGVAEGETDKLAGQRVRLYVTGTSGAELIFHNDSPPAESARPK